VVLDDDDDVDADDDVVDGSSSNPLKYSQDAAGFRIGVLPSSFDTNSGTSPPSSTDCET
jgi:hypothetical protein